MSDLEKEYIQKTEKNWVEMPLETDNLSNRFPKWHTFCQMVRQFAIANECLLRVGKHRLDSISPTIQNKFSISLAPIVLKSSGTFPSPSMNPNRLLCLVSILLGTITGSVSCQTVLAIQGLVSGVLNYELYQAFWKFRSFDDLITQSLPPPFNRLFVPPLDGSH